ncbi:sensor histidine kinase [Sphingomonas lenta]|uniref:histidine kinase n=1 Tax=Sphingomonas lenta TaxID=1141887 RepID=A0A2A2SJZ1_9SPHN|nr:ATP-binding protein [Sphingomonas lenta]PAX09597.1 PAS domain-containing sensor histidine kinase [Sphingomonas lenta]
MNAAAVPAIDQEDPPWRFSVTPAIEFAVLAAVIIVAAVSYSVVSASAAPQRLLTPLLVASLLVANLVPGVLLMMLLGRRIARRRAAASPVGGTGRLHVRLVALFSTMAAVPMLLVTIVASLLFQYGVQFWYSDRARGMLENATDLARTSYQQQLQRWREATLTMADDMSMQLRAEPIDSPNFPTFFVQQVYYRSLSEAALLNVPASGEVRTLAVVNPYEVELAGRITPDAVRRLRAGEGSVVLVTGDRIQTITTVPGAADLFLYAARVGDTKVMTEQNARAEAVVADYRSLLARARSLQLQFNAALLLISLLIVGIAVWIALKVADRLVAPVGELVGAARRVAGGDLSARVSDPKSRDEVGTLARVFNQMTGQLEQQNAALVSANLQLENRRALIEAVMAGVSAGVIATSPGRLVQIANRSAAALLGVEDPPGKPLAQVSPELDALVESGQREGVVQIGHGLDARTLAVRIARAPAGPILTFDDITRELADQRRAAWSDVARRIAHEIKNPLTPIQLAAERLQRRYGAKVGEGDETFGRLTDTIVRQVGDLRRMVDEFSAFARMPKPVFRDEAICEVARDALFLHEVAHPDIRFQLGCDDPQLRLVCDRRQIGQALTNIVKNAAEAIEAKGEGVGAITMQVRHADSRVSIEVADTGVGLPADRERIVEPYMTTRARGTGLGLAIVKKIVEEHLGAIGFADREEGGTVVTMTFDATALAALDQHAVDRPAEQADDERPIETERT